ncbi:cullin-domain-containing protein [Coleophoma cylindrospora]|uniref:Cullin-domain-containing protein n=1 Tax=Coleophoma cylindrospora TaxID=1849047 RepID=A0A3D8SFJ7_9HELO|nr:cullin-domain-containing protein [Coleophoma cylindrospora]
MVGSHFDGALAFTIAQSTRQVGLGASASGSDFDTQWDILRSALREIHEKNASKLSFEQLYRASYKIVLKKQGEMLYDRVKEYEEQWFGSEVMPKIGKLITKNLTNVTLGGVPGTTANERRITGEQFLKGLKATWEDHITCMNMTTDVLMYMDRVYCQDNRKASIFTTSMGLFREHILRSRAAASSCITFDILNYVILDMIHMERDGDVIDRNLIRSCVYMLEGLYESDDENETEKLYLTVFEPEFIRTSNEFYFNECEKLLRESDAGTWLRQTRKRLAEEAARCQTTLSQLTDSKIAKVVEDQMITLHLNDFLAMEGSGLKAMIENDRFEDLTILYQLLTKVDKSQEALKIALQARVVDLGREINKSISETNFAIAQPKDDDAAAEGADKPKAQILTAAAQATAAAIKWVDEVLQLKDKFDNMWETCFEEDRIIQTALTLSFSEFINAEPRCSEYVSLFIDENLKRGIKGKTEAEVDAVLDKAITLIRYIQDKDMFERYYKKHLTRRLLLGKSESSDVEKQMVSRMKQEVGNYFTSKIEGMFKDMSTSTDLTNDYRQHIQGLGEVDRKQIDLTVNILTSNYWPSEALGGGKPEENGIRQDCQWPSEIRSLQDSFTSFYLKSRNGRKLTWLGYLGHADVKCHFPKIPGKESSKERRYDLNVPTYGLIILLLFNDLPEGSYLSFEDIQEKTQISTTDLSKALTSIAVLPKARVLRKDPMNKEIAKPGDRFYFNEAFVSKTTKIKAPVMAGSSNKVEGDEERKATEDKNDEHRGNTIDLCVVRTMKARKELTHQNLFAEVIAQLSSRFKPDVGMMKKRVESLIEREYMERVENASVPTYRYMA